MNVAGPGTMRGGVMGVPCEGHLACSGTSSQGGVFHYDPGRVGVHYTGLGAKEGA